MAVTKSLGTIQMEYSKAKKQAKELEQLASDLKNVSENLMGSTLSQIQNSWGSDSSKSYLAKGKKVQQDIETRAKELKKAAETIRQIAKKTYDADMRAYEIAVGVSQLPLNQN